jgi:Integrase zinc binding domain
VLKELPANTRITVVDGIILVEEKIYLSQELRKEVFRQCHEVKTAGYQGNEGTLERMKRIYYFPKMRRYVEDNVRKCDTCQRNKSARHALYGKMMLNQALRGAWQDVALDFVTKLPLFKEPMTGVMYDSIMVVTDRLTKYAYFIPYLESFLAEDLAYMFHKHVVANHGFLQRIISDRDKLFTSRFWKSLMDLLGVYYKLSTAYYP